MSKAEYSVGAVAKRCGVNVSALHFYEQKGLIHSLRNAGNQRRYRKDVFRRVSLIKAAQTMGISLEEIKTALGKLPDKRTPTQGDWEKLSKQWQGRLDERIAHLEKLRDLLDGCIGCGCLSMAVCPLYNHEDELAAEGPGPVLLNRKNK